MNIQNLNIGDIIIYNIENNNAKVVVVGTEPISTDGGYLFKAVLKENRREVFKLSNNNSTVSTQNGAAYVISSFNDAVGFNIRNVFPNKTSDFYDQMTEKVNLALRKRNWVFDSIVPTVNDSNDMETVSEPEEAPAPTTATSVFTVTITHSIDEDTADVLDALNDMISDEYDDFTITANTNTEI